ncbi:MAG: SDR family oxidoreductase [Gammaproteobacteria bacterium]
MNKQRASPGTVLVSGANRGLGLEYCRQLSAAGWRVLAACREPDRAAELKELARASRDRVSILRLDVVNESQVEDLAKDLAGKPLDMLINNAGTFGPEGTPGGMRYQSLDMMDYAIWRDILEVNVLAQFRMTVAMAHILRIASRPVVVMLSSDLGSIANNTQGQSHAYRTSKTALNMLTRSIAIEWRDLIIVSMAPGWCKTDLGGAQAQIDPADSVRDQLDTFATLTPAHSGQFIDRFGKPVAW